MKDDIRFHALPVRGIEAMHATSQRSFPAMRTINMASG
jgi:hypothetical protein